MGGASPPAADDVPLLQIGGQHAVKGLVPTPGGIAVVKPTSPAGVEERKHFHLPTAPTLPEIFPFTPKGMQQAEGYIAVIRSSKKAVACAFLLSARKKQNRRPRVF